MLSRLKLTTSAVILAAVGLTGCSSGNTSTPSSPTPVTPADVTITIVGMNGALSFSPNPGTIKIGQTVAWRNADNTTHTATSDTGTFNVSVSPGATSSPIVMSTAGSFNYHCTIHPTMIGTLNVQ